MEIPQSLFDEGIKNSGHIDEISVVHPHSGYYAELIVKQSKKFEFKMQKFKLEIKVIDISLKIC